MVMNSVMNQAEVIHIDFIIILLKLPGYGKFRRTGLSRAVFCYCFYVAIGMISKGQCAVGQETDIRFSLVPGYFPYLVPIIGKPDEPVDNIRIVYKFN